MTNSTSCAARPRAATSSSAPGLGASVGTGRGGLTCMRCARARSRLTTGCAWNCDAILLRSVRRLGYGKSACLRGMSPMLLGCVGPSVGLSLPLEVRRPHATDDSRGGEPAGSSARQALAFAVELARPVGGRLVLAGVVLGHGRRPTSAAELRRAHRELDALRNASGCGVPMAVEVISSPSLLRGLHDSAVLHDAQLLVLEGGHRAAVEQDPARGDLAADVVCTAPCAVAVASGERQLGSAPKRIGAASNETAEADEALQWAVRFGELAGAGVQIVRVLEPRHPEATTPEGSTDERVQNLAHSLMPRAAVDTKLVWGDAGPMLCQASRELDLLVLGSRARSGLRRAVQGERLHGRAPRR